jgi:hypothetical protein
MDVHLSLAEGHNLWAGSWASSVQLTVSGKFNGLYYSAIVIVYKWFTNVTADSIVKPGGQQCGDTWPKCFRRKYEDLF